VRGALLMAYQNVLDLVLLEQLVVDEQDRPAGIAEDLLDFFRLQALYKDFRTR
jgi:hypothetical protein